jgi:hypothetical protein
MPNDQGYNARLQEHGGPRVKGEQGNGRTLRQRGNSRAYVIARLERDAANGGGRDVMTLLEGVLSGRISAFAAGVEMGYCRRREPTGRGSENVSKRLDWAMHKLLNPRPDPKAPTG